MVRFILTPPPEFSPGNPYASRNGAEGYWSWPPGVSPKIDQSKLYLPKISKLSWPGKMVFATAVKHLERMCTPSGKPHGMRLRTYPGRAPSRIPKELLGQDHLLLGSKEYIDENHGILWPEQYVDHYIVRYNVMPTQRFYHYVVSKMFILQGQSSTF